MLKLLSRKKREREGKLVREKMERGRERGERERGERGRGEERRKGRGNDKKVRRVMGR